MFKINSPDRLAVAAGRKIKERDYWLKKLAGEPGKSRFPYDHKESKTEAPRDTAQDTVRFEFSRELLLKLMTLCDHSDIRLHMVLVAVLVVLVRKYNYDGADDIIVGTPIYRQDIDAEFINTVLILRNRLEEDMTFKQLLLQVRETIAEATEHWSYPMEILMEQLNLPVSRGDSPLFDMALLVENIHDREYLRHIPLNIVFSFLRTAKNIQGVIEYNPLRYEKTTIERIASHFTTLLQGVLHDVNTPVARLDIASAEEKKKSLFDFNGTASGYPAHKTINRLFEEQVEKTPGHIALICGGKQVTYEELDKRANRLAGALGKKIVRPDMIIAIMVERSLETAMGILGILKAGGAYLPLDPELPLKRITAMMDDCQVSLLITKLAIFEKHRLAALQQNYHLKDIKPHLTSRRPQVPDFNQLPFPDRSLVNYEKYNKSIGQALVKNCISIQATRGCPYKCIYCHKVWPKTHIFRSAENIFAEVELYQRMGVRRFAFIDDIFNLNRKNSTRLFQLIVKNKLDLHLFFPNGVRGDILDEDYIDLMVEAGAVNIALALETASPRLQELIGKKLNLEKFRHNIEYLIKKYPQVIIDLFTMHGFPSETREEAMMTLDFIKSLHWVDFPWLWILKIYPDTDMARLAIENGVPEEAIAKSLDLAFHELPETLPWDKSFTKQYKADYFNNYFLLKERLLSVLPCQLTLLSEDEMVQQYNSILPEDIRTYPQLLDFLNLSKEELGMECLDDEVMYIPDINEKMRTHFSAGEKPAEKGALKVLLLDLSLTFSHKRDVFYDIHEPPLGPMYLLTYLKQQLGTKVHTRMVKSMIDFDSYSELKEILEDFKADVIGIRTITFYRDFFHQTIAVIRQWGIDVPIIAGGPYATSSYKTILQDRNVNLVVLGEGEITFCELIKKIMANDGQLPGENVLKEIPGIALIPGKANLEKKLAREVFVMDAPGWEEKESGANLKPGSKPGDLAYIIFTSGSTGNPKAVGVEHNGVVNMLTARKDEYKINPGFTTLQLFPYIFDGFITSFFTPLISGGKVIILTEGEILDMAKVKETIVKTRVNHFISIPEFYRIIIENLSGEEAAGLQMVTLAGSSITSGILGITKSKNKNIEIINEYGVTESSVLSTLYRDQQTDDRVKIGKPIRNTRIYIIDKKAGPQPPGVVGEMCIAGAGLGRGYLNNPELTGERFVNYKLQNTNYKQRNNEKLLRGVQGGGFLEKSPPGRRRQKLYKTGDLARVLPDGNLELLGRIDQQVKIRGFRIELGEIERRLLEHIAIKEALVMTCAGNRPGEAGSGDREGNKSLAAYYVLRTDTEKPPELWPSVAEFFVYDDLLYYAMTSDERRNDSYKVAINRLVKDKVVVDIGTGADAILSRFCVEAGAKKVYALEVLAETWKKAKETIRELGLQDKITLIHGDAAEVRLPEKVDVCVSEIVGSLGGSEGAAVILNRGRRLLKENGIMIPAKSITKIAAVSLPREIRQNPGFTPTPGEYVEKIFRAAGHPFDLRLCIKHFPKAKILSNTQVFEHLDFSGLVAEEGAETLNFTINKASRLHGFLAWLHLETVENETIDILEHEYSWLPVFIPVFYPGSDVSEGDRIEATSIRTLGENNLNPDYRIKGVLLRKNGENLRFDYELPHFEKSFQKNAFYRELFPQGTINRIETTPADSTPSVSQLRNYLSEHLPEYFVPTYFLRLDAIPLTPGGKVDKKALPDPQSGVIGDYVAPRNKEEEILANLWQDVLGIERIGIDDNFFEIGGDSLKAIHISAKMQKYNLKLNLNDLFSNPTISQLGKFVKKIYRGADQETVEGEVSLTPIQEWFFQGHSSQLHHFNQAVMNYDPRGFDEEIVREVFTKIAAHHDALRMIFRVTGDKIVQRNRGIEGKLFNLELIDLKDKKNIETEIEKEANRLHAGFDLEKGPLVNLGLFRTASGDYLLMVIHHTVMDGVSMRILLEDFSLGYRQAQKGEEIKFQAKTDSFQYWSQQLRQYAESEKALKELDYWKQIEDTPIEPLPGNREIDEQKKKMKYCQTVSMSLNTKETENLLKEVNWAYNTGINDILLTALAKVIKEWSGLKRILVNLEGHGREEIIEGVNIHRTIGWFTSQYPLLLDTGDSRDIPDLVDNVKETLRRVPNRGIGYGILRYLTPAGIKGNVRFKREPEISFNYLGQFGQKRDGTGSSAGPGMKSGNPVSPEMEWNCVLSLNGMVKNGLFNLSFTYNRYEYDKKSIQQFVRGYKSTLLDIIAHCLKKKEEADVPGIGALEYQVRQDYEKYLEKVRLEKWPDLTAKTSYEHILLTGATGYLGANLLPGLLESTKATLYLLVRGDTPGAAAKRLEHKIVFYLGRDFYEAHCHRWTVVSGDLGKNDLGIDPRQYEKLTETVDAVIHPAANVKHFGLYEELYEDNVMGTERLLEYSLKGKKKDFHFISTFDVGNGNIPGKEYVVYTEYCHDVGQESRNLYKKSKFEAEKRLLAYRDKGLNASIYRVGNLIFQSETGKFQENIEGDYFYAIVKAVIELGILPGWLKGKTFDMSFVNYTARAVTLLINRAQFKNETFHIHNPNTLKMEDLVEMLKQAGIEVKDVKEKQLHQHLKKHHGDTAKENLLERVKLHLGINEGKVEETRTIYKADRTFMILKELGFDWIKVTPAHIKKMVDYCRTMGFIDNSGDHNLKNSRA